MEVPMNRRRFAALLRNMPSLAKRLAQPLSGHSLLRMARTLGPSVAVLAFAGISSVAHAQGTMDFSGATTLMGTFKTFAIYAGAVICFGGLIFAGIRMLSGRFSDAIPGLFGALFGAAVLGWGAGWIPHKNNTTDGLRESASSFRASSLVSSCLPSAHGSILLRHILVVRLVLRLLPPRNDCLACAHEMHHYALGGRGGKFDFVVQLAIAQVLVVQDRPFCGADREDQARGNEEGWSHLGPVGTLVEFADVQPHCRLLKAL
jgi:hypothetical protein